MQEDIFARREKENDNMHGFHFKIMYAICFVMKHCIRDINRFVEYLNIDSKDQKSKILLIYQVILSSF